MHDTHGTYLKNPDPDSLHSQLEDEDYNLSQKRQEDICAYEDPLGADAAHGLAACHNPTEREAIATFLEAFTPMRLFGIDREECPDNAWGQSVLFGEIRPGVPVIAVLQAHCQNNDNLGSSDGMFAALYQHPVYGVQATHKRHFEYDGPHHRGQNKFVVERQDERREANAGVETWRTLDEDHLEEGELEKTRKWRKAFVKGASREVEERLSIWAAASDDMFSSKYQLREEHSLKDQLGLKGFDTRPLERFAHQHCIWSYRNAAETQLVVNVQRDAVSPFGSTCKVRDVAESLNPEDASSEGCQLQEAEAK